MPSVEDRCPLSRGPWGEFAIHELGSRHVATAPSEREAPGLNPSSGFRPRRTDNEATALTSQMQRAAEWLGLGSMA
jgi:hypothetical protein